MRDELLVDPVRLPDGRWQLSPPTYPEWLAARCAYLRRSRRRAQWRRYSSSEKGRARTDRYEATPKARARKQFYEATVRAAMRAPNGALAGMRKDGRPKYTGFVGCYRVSYAHPTDYGVTAPSPELMRLEQWLRPDEFAARAEYAERMRAERRARTTGPLTLGQLVQARA